MTGRRAELPLGQAAQQHRPTEQKIRVNVALQDDFSMDQELSLYLLETVPLMDPQQPDYAMVLLTLVGSLI